MDGWMDDYCPFSPSLQAVLAARFAFDFSKCIGVEVLSSLHRQAMSVLQRYAYVVVVDRVRLID